MTEPTFKDIFKLIISPLITEVEKDLDEEFKNATDFKRSNLDILYENCAALYQSRREELKELFYGTSYKPAFPSTQPHYLDLHKIGAIVCYCLVKYKVFWFDEKKACNYINEKYASKVSTDWHVANVLINYKLAFHASLAIIYYKILFDCKTHNNMSLYNVVEKNQSLILYPTRPEHESFENSIIIDLAKRNVNGRSFDCLLYAAVLFQLEEHNLRCFSDMLEKK